MTQTLVLLIRVSQGLKRNLHDPARTGVPEKSGNATERPGLGETPKADSVAGFGGTVPVCPPVALIPGSRHQMTSLNQARLGGACWPDGVLSELRAALFKGACGHTGSNGSRKFGA